MAHKLLAVLKIASEVPRLENVLLLSRALRPTTSYNAQTIIMNSVRSRCIVLITGANTGLGECTSFDGHSKVG